MTVPVYLVAGFLGSGKTTLLKRMVEHLNAKGESPLVLMNEFGETNIDNELLEGQNAQMRELIDGCICCTSKTELTKTLYDIVANDKPTTVLMEATGLADPVEILDICTLPNMLDKLQLRSIISVVDANRWGRVAPAEALMKRQARFADVLLLNKSDLVDDARIAEVEGELKDLNQRAPMKRTVNSDVPIDDLFSETASAVERDPDDHTACDHDHDHCVHDGDEHHHHDHAHDHYLSFTVRVDGTADKAAFNDFLNDENTGLLRLKGFVQVAGVEPQGVLQWTAGDWTLAPLPEQFKAKPNVLVFIGDGLDRDAICKRLEATGLKPERVAHNHDHSHEHAHHEH